MRILDIKFLTKILNLQMGILTQSQTIFWENSNFQNRLNQQILTPGKKKFFYFEEPNYHTYFHQLFINL